MAYPRPDRHAEEPLSEDPDRKNHDDDKDQSEDCDRAGIHVPSPGQIDDRDIAKAFRRARPTHARRHTMPPPTNTQRMVTRGYICMLCGGHRRRRAGTVDYI
jgi:hypothetical protein